MRGRGRLTPQRARTDWVSCGCHQVGHLCSQEMVLQGAEVGAQEGALLLLDITQHLPHAAAQLGSSALHMPARQQNKCISSDTSHLWGQTMQAALQQHASRRFHLVVRHRTHCSGESPLSLLAAQHIHLCYLQASLPENTGLADADMPVE